MTKEQKENVIRALERKEDDLIVERMTKEVLYRASQSEYVKNIKDDRLGGAMTQLKKELDFIEVEIRQTRGLIKELKDDKCEINI